MPRHTSKAGNLALGLVIILALIVLALGKIIDAVGYVLPLAVCVAVIGALIWYASNKRKKRLEYLRSKYRDETVVQGILAHRFWQGQTAEQLVDSLGKPPSVDERVLKAKEREVWKYNPRGANRYDLRITVESGIVIGWDQKSR
jgi:hypothetical protein